MHIISAEMFWEEKKLPSSKFLILWRSFSSRKGFSGSLTWGLISERWGSVTVNAGKSGDIACLDGNIKVDKIASENVIIASKITSFLDAIFDVHKQINLKLLISSSKPEHKAMMQKK